MKPVRLNEVETVPYISECEAVDLFCRRGGRAPQCADGASIHVVRVDTLGADLAVGAWLLTAQFHRDRAALAGDLCLVEFSRDQTPGLHGVSVRQVWSEWGGRVRIIHPAAPDDGGLVVRRCDLPSVFPFFGAVVFDGAASARSDRGGRFIPASHWRGVAGRIMPAMSA